MSTASDRRTAGKRGQSTNFWIIALIVLLLVFAGNTIYALSKTARLSGASAAASELQVNSQRLANLARDAASGVPESFDPLQEVRNAMAEDVEHLVSNYGSSAEVGEQVENLSATWEQIAFNADRILAGREASLAMSSHVDAFNEKVPTLQAQLDEVVRAMSAGGSGSSQVYVALRQVVLVSSMARRLAEVRVGAEESAEALEALKNDSAMFTNVMNGLRSGDPAISVQRLEGNRAAALAKARATWDAMKTELDAILEQSDALLEAQASALAVSGLAPVMLEDSRSVFDQVTSFGRLDGGGGLLGNTWISILSGLGVLIALGGLLWSLNRTQRTQLSSSMELNNRNQEAIMRLLDEMGSLAEGDLTVKATVTEDMTGAIADSINFAIEQLRSLVQTITDTSVQVASSAQESQATAMHLAEAAEFQAQEINSASDRINQIAASIDRVSQNSAQSADVAQRSVQIATKGAGVVRETIAGMDSIRDQMQETSKRIKRLGESSQEIGSIVELINDISEQTNILALNASIQAASAGEAGRGFAVVADEVQRLAERASNATKRIESLVQTIQADTNEAVSSMEQTTSEVVAGARLAEDAGTALGEIESVSTNLAGLIQGISSAAQEQSQAASNITQTMHTIQSITAQTSQGANQTAESIGNLAQLAADLRRSVADFKLPA